MPTAKRVLNRETYYPGHILMTQGEMGTAAYFIERGKVQVYIRGPEGKKVVLADLGPGAIVGEMAVISQEPRSATAEVTEEAVMVQMTAHDFSERLKNSDGIFQTIIKVLIERLRAANKNIFHVETTLEALEEKVKTTVHAVSGSIPKEKQEEFRHEVSPLLNNLLGTLKKYTGDIKRG